MKYILKYRVKSKYFGFEKEYYKEFETKFNIFHFLANNQQVVDWDLYKLNICSFNELLNFENVPIGKQQDY